MKKIIIFLFLIVTKLIFGNCESSLNTKLLQSYINGIEAILNNKSNFNNDKEDFLIIENEYRNDIDYIDHFGAIKNIYYTGKNKIDKLSKDSVKTYSLLQPLININNESDIDCHDLYIISYVISEDKIFFMVRNYNWWYQFSAKIKKEGKMISIIEVEKKAIPNS